MTGYGGREYREGQSAQDVPPAPQSDAESLRDGAGSYARVRLIGHCGAGCARRQTLDFQNVMLAQARQLRWDYYGLCGAQMTCYDRAINGVHEE